MEANRLNKLTQQARRESYSLNHDYIGSEHLLLALMKTDSVATKALEAAGANYDLLRQVVINNIGKGQAMRPATEYSKKVRQILELARLNANKFGNSSAGEEDVLFAILADDDSLTNIMFLLSGVEKEVVKRNLKELLQDQNPEVASIKDLSENVSNYARDLNEEAESGKIDPVIGRDDEIERVIQILMRRTKNNPILIGEPGVGKTAISEGLAQRIVEGEVPRIIEDKTILSLDLASMIAGTKYRGDFEERLKKLFDELATHDEIILFIDEFHMVLGAGAAEGSMDAANILKPILAKGDIQIIGATTIEEYRKYIEKDSALTRRMQPIQVEEPSLSDSRKIIYGIKDKYEAHHGVEITDDAINAAVELTDRYINDRYLPDKAIDVIDEAMSKVRIKAYQEEETSTNPQEKIQELVVEKEQAVKDQDFEKAAELRDRINQARFDMEAEIEKKNKDKPNLFIDFDDIANASKSFLSIEHRLEFVDEVNNVKIYNDSKGTNVDSSVKAIESFDNPLIVIAGGYDKKIDYSDYVKAFKKNGKVMVIMGQTKDQLKGLCEDYNVEYQLAEDMEDAVKKSVDLANQGDIILLSPASASWDMYDSYEIRGKDFKEKIKKYKGNIE